MSEMQLSTLCPPVIRVISREKDHFTRKSVVWIQFYKAIMCHTNVNFFIQPNRVNTNSNGFCMIFVIKMELRCITGERSEYSVPQTIHVFSDSCNMQFVGAYGLMTPYASDTKTVMIGPSVYWSRADQIIKCIKQRYNNNNRNITSY